MEVIAVYWEKNIKTYGFQVKTGLRLVTAVMAPERLAGFCELLERAEETPPSFLMALAQPAEENSMRLHLLLEPPSNGQRADGAQALDAAAAAGDFEVDAPVGAWAGRPVRVELSTRTGDPAGEHLLMGGWAEPRVVIPAAGEGEPAASELP